MGIGHSGWLSLVAVLLSGSAAGPPAGQTAMLRVAEPAAALPPEPTCAWRDTPLDAGNLGQVGMASLCLLNHERVRQGVPPVFGDRRLQSAAVDHARDQVARDFLAHTNPDGCDPSCRAAVAGYPGAAAENLYGGAMTARAAVQGWLASPGHRSNMLDRRYLSLGAGVALGGRYGSQWVHDFGLETAPFLAVSGLEPAYQGPADPTGTGGGAFGGGAAPPEGPTASPQGGSSMPVPAIRGSAGLRLRSVRILGGRLTVRLTIAARARGGRLTGRLRVGPRSFGFSARISRSTLRIARRLPRSLWRLGSGRLTVSYAGSERLLPAEVSATLAGSD